MCSVAAACAKWLNTKDKDTRRTLSAEIVAAAIVGVVVFLVYMWKEMNVFLAYLASIGLGFIAVEITELIARYALAQASKKLNVEQNNQEDKKD